MVTTTLALFLIAAPVVHGARIKSREAVFQTVIKPTCSGENITVMCADDKTPCTGDVCCPGFEKSGGITYPCASASAGFGKCASDAKLQTCSDALDVYSQFIKDREAAAAKLTKDLKDAEETMCLDKATKCRGTMCCPGFEGSHNKTYPCPLASKDFKECELEVLPESLLQADAQDVLSGMCADGTLCTGDSCCPPHEMSQMKTYPCPVATGNPLCQSSKPLCSGENTTVMCADDKTPCTGNVCCPGFEKSGGVTYPCPSASAGFSKCASSARLQPCNDALLVYSKFLAERKDAAAKLADDLKAAVEVYCHDKATKCRGNMCCPPFEGSDNKTYPCPGASEDFGDCEVDNIA